ncbi:hypothetical protein FISHEDRAFT_11865, partial [Fistulina hepatica ATCC 64428]
QVQTFYSQVSGLATEADRLRRRAIADMFPPAQFIDGSFQPRYIAFLDSAAVSRTLIALKWAGCTHRSVTYSVIFLPRPPLCMPLHVPSCAQSGYWFAPNLPLPDETPFELIVEGAPSQWTYLGRYTTAPLTGHEMRLSEWMLLDERTKAAHCARIQPHSYAAQLEVKRRYDTGEWGVPCFNLHCVGFDHDLLAALQAAATAI